MIIPVRCFTCNNVIGSKYEKYIEEMNKYLNFGESIDSTQSNPELKNFNNEKIIIPLEAKDLGELLFRENMVVETEDLSYYEDMKTDSWENKEDAILNKSDSLEKTTTIEVGNTVEEIDNENKVFKIKGRWFRNKIVENMQMRIFKRLGVTRYCCKRHLLTHVDLINIID